MSDNVTTRESLLAEFKAARESAITKSHMDVNGLAEKHRQERADALKAFAEKRDGLIQGYKDAGIPDGAFPSLLAIDQARHMEPIVHRQVHEYNEAMSIEGVPTWEGFLMEKSKAGETLADELLAELEAKKSKEESLENGLEGEPMEPGKLKVSLFDGLTYDYDKDADSVHYKRSADGTELFEDKGSRIEMKETSAQSIETALLLAQERFKKGTPLTITGDEDFKKDAARIAGRLGIPIKNKDLMDIWQQAHDKAAMGISDEEPDIAPRNGFTGKEAEQDLGKSEPGKAAPDKSAPDTGLDKGNTAESQAKSGKAKEAPKEEQRLQLLDYGHAPYQHKEGESMSYFVKTRDANGKENTTWGVDLQRAVEESGAGKGDMITLRNLGKQDVVVKIIGKDGSEEWKPTHRNSFDLKVADMPLRAAPHMLADAQKHGFSVKDGRVIIPADTYLAAKADLSVLSATGFNALHKAAQASFADLGPLDRHALISANLANENGLNRTGFAAALTNDRLLEIRRMQSPENLKGAIQTGYEKAAIAQNKALQDKDPDLPSPAKTLEAAQEQDQKRILIRNEDQQAQERKSAKKERKLEERKIERKVRQPQRDKGQELSR
ncbi:LPD7 domain-containing protein [Acidithiobacillus caldus]|uniref:LPD7 domain-containing protein n=1 Tax=Acidithiobacillus caldus TaxID=33059 RepID=UPI001C071B42|nr:LPD7 domain-containing protein [Acidithiobacillus caldus]MBU2770106.1 hypothetical protein [Acidithiobacillus caldus]